MERELILSRNIVLSKKDKTKFLKVLFRMEYLETLLQEMEHFPIYIKVHGSFKAIEAIMNLISSHYKSTIPQVKLAQLILLQLQSIAYLVNLTHP